MNSSSADKSQGMDDFDKQTRALLTRVPSFLNLMKNIRNGDHKSYVEILRSIMVLSNHPGVKERLKSEIREEIILAGVNIDSVSLSQNLIKKDTFRRFGEYVDGINKHLSSYQSFLSEGNFDSRLNQYKSIIDYVEKTWAGACDLYKRGNYPLSTFVSILVIEEIGKLACIFLDLVFHDRFRPKKRDGAVERDHRVKHFVGVVSGALVNARLDRVLGKGVVRKILNQAERGELENIRQGCLYIDIRKGLTVTPRDIVSARDAKVLVVLAGELMADALGHFPWEFERLLGAVIEFERAIGFPEKKIARR